MDAHTRSSKQIPEEPFFAGMSEVRAGQPLLRVSAHRLGRQQVMGRTLLEKRLRLLALDHLPFLSLL